jgi:hypothetical protein
MILRDFISLLETDEWKKQNTWHCDPKKVGGGEYDLEISTNICEIQMEEYKLRQHVSYYLILSVITSLI